MASYRKRGRIPDEIECLPIAKRINLLSIGHGTSLEGSSSSESQSPKDNSTSQPSVFQTNPIHSPAWGISPSNYDGQLLELDSRQIDPRHFGPAHFDPNSGLHVDRNAGRHHSGNLDRDQYSSATQFDGGHVSMDHATFLPVPGFSDVPRVDQQLLMAAEAYQPEMDESLNPHYYHVNALLFKMHQSRLTRNH